MMSDAMRKLLTEHVELTRERNAIQCAIEAKTEEIRQLQAIESGTATGTKNPTRTTLGTYAEPIRIGEAMLSPA
jgi:hypothetical protein